MLSLNGLSNKQKADLRNAFMLIDGGSKDSIITKDDLIKLYSDQALPPPSDKELTAMIGDTEIDGKKGINFGQFLNIMASQIQAFDSRNVIYEALKTFAEGTDINELVIDADTLKEQCCSVTLDGDDTISRSTFETLVRGFVNEQSNGKRLFLASNWLDAYID